MIVAKITQEKADALQGTEYVTGNKYNPIQDADGDWIISLIEAQYLEVSDIALKEYKPIESEN